MRATKESRSSDGHALVVDMEEILPPGILMEPEELRVLEQAEAVDDLPFDLELAGVQCLRLRGTGEETERTATEEEAVSTCPGL